MAASGLEQVGKEIDVGLTDAHSIEQLLQVIGKRRRRWASRLAASLCGYGAHQQSESSMTAKMLLQSSTGSDDYIDQELRGKTDHRIEETKENADQKQSLVGVEDDDAIPETSRWPVGAVTRVARRRLRAEAEGEWETGWLDPFVRNEPVLTEGLILKRVVADIDGGPECRQRPQSSLLRVDMAASQPLNVIVMRSTAASARCR
ncbi:hypothetical protein PHSY_000967 [Pseudozyma hubeiensis SY62]|uniref:Uncharacterized protein n=1 Tax=Pseudozyma hubeiensis (strain SY62) TaxID=1305764 RepID=R9NXW5_PSEHS|nr:hypothetical protein PHSY_000967 [Pseudozyma hubeiensis SY62]GAC93402.1 hypothetical protein PHSY_000967 [Pseudozyma hubeiensis SY62]